MTTLSQAKEQLQRALDDLPAEALAEVQQFVEFLQFKSHQPPSAPTTQGWPPDFFEQTFGALPDLPDRAPQGEYEVRKGLA